MALRTSTFCFIFHLPPYLWRRRPCPAGLTSMPCPTRLPCISCSSGGYGLLAGRLSRHQEVGNSNLSALSFPAQSLGILSRQLHVGGTQTEWILSEPIFLLTTLDIVQFALIHKMDIVPNSQIGYGFRIAYMYDPWLKPSRILRIEKRDR